MDKKLLGTLAIGISMGAAGTKVTQTNPNDEIRLAKVCLVSSKDGGLDAIGHGVVGGRSMSARYAVAQGPATAFFAEAERGFILAKKK